MKYAHMQEPAGDVSRGSEAMDRLFGGPGFALQLVLDVTQRCNISCTFCPRHLLQRHGTDWTTGQLAQCVATSKYKVAHVTFAGSFGEPALNVNLPDMVSFLAARGTGVTVFSNGLALSPPLVSDLVNRGVGHFWISTVGLTTDATTRYMRGMDMTVLERNLEHLGRLTASGRVGITIGVVGVRDALANLPATVDACARFGFKAISVKSLFSREVVLGGEAGPGGSDLQEELDLDRNIERYRALYAESLRQATRAGIKLFANEPLSWQLLGTSHAEGRSTTPVDAGGRVSRLCAEPFAKPVVNFRGEAFPCCSESACQMGNVFREGLDGVLDGPGFDSLRRGLLTGELHPICRECTRAQLAPLGRVRRHIAMHLERGRGVMRIIRLPVRLIAPLVWKLASGVGAVR